MVNCGGDGTIDKKSGLTLVEAQELQCLGGGVNDGGLLCGSVGETEIAKISCGGIRDGGVGIIKRVENGGIDELLHLNLRLDSSPGSIWSSEGSGAGKKSAGGIDEMVILYVMSS